MEPTAKQHWLNSSEEDKLAYLEKMGVEPSDELMDNLNSGAHFTGGTDYEDRVIDSIGRNINAQGVAFEDNWAAHQTMQRNSDMLRDIKSNATQKSGWNVLPDALAEGLQGTARGLVTILNWDVDPFTSDQIHKADPLKLDPADLTPKSDVNDYLEPEPIPEEPDTWNYLDAADLYFAKKSAQRAKDWEGVSGGLKFFKWTADTAASIGSFVIMGGVGGAVGKGLGLVSKMGRLGTSTKVLKAGELAAAHGTTAGIVTLVSAHAKLKGDDIYRRTGDAGLATVAGVLNGVGTMLIFRFAGAISHKGISKRLDDMWASMHKEGLKKAALKLHNGETKGLAQFLVNALKIEATVIGIRSAEFALTSTYNELVSEADLPELDMSNPQAWQDVLAHGAEEGAIFIGMPGVVKTVGGSLSWSGKRYQMATHGMRKQIFHVTSKMLSDTTDAVKTMGELDAIKSSNPVFTFVKETIRNAFLEKEGKPVKDIDKFDMTDMKAGEKTAILNEASALLKDVFGEAPVVDAKITPEGTKPVSKAKAKETVRENSKLRKQQRAEEAQRNLDRIKAKKDKEGVEDIEGADRIDIGGMKTPAERKTAEQKAEDTFLDASGMQKKLLEGEVETLKAKDKLTQKEKDQLTEFEFILEIVKNVEDLSGGPGTGLNLKESRKRWGEYAESANKEKEQYEAWRKAHKEDGDVVRTLILDVKATPGVVKRAVTNLLDNLVSRLETLGWEAKAIDKLPEIKQLRAALKEMDTITGKGKNEKIRKELEKFEELGGVFDQIKGRLESQEHAMLTSGLKFRKLDDPFTGLSPILDSVLINIKRHLMPSSKDVQNYDWSKAPSLKEAIDNYINTVSHRGIDESFVGPRTKDGDLKARMETARDIIEKRKLEDLTIEEATFIHEVVESLHLQHRVGRELKLARENAELNLLAKGLQKELQEGIDGLNETSSWLSEGSAGLESVFSLVKAVSYGLEVNGRLTDHVEFVFGGTETMGYKLLVRDVQQGYNDALLSLGRIQMDLDNFIRNVKGLPNELIESLSDSNVINSKRKNNKHYKPAAKVNHNGIELHFSAGEIVGLLMQLADPTTKKLIYEKNAGLFFRGWEKNPNIKSKDMAGLVDKIVDQATPEQRALAEAMVEFVNKPEVKNVVRDIGIEMYGIDIIAKSGNTWMFRRRIKDSDNNVIKDKAPTDIWEGAREEAGLGVIDYGPEFSTSPAGRRVEGSTYSIVIGDGMFSFNRWIKSVTNLQHIEKPMTLAQRLLKSNQVSEHIIRTKGGEHKMSSDLLANINTSFYENAIKVENASYNMVNPLEGGLRTVRNNIVASGLAFNPVIPLYQPLSMIAAMAFMGEGGKTAIFQAIKEATVGGKEWMQLTKERGARNSGLLYQRFVH